jgi:hypothetical protein
VSVSVLRIGAGILDRSVDYLRAMPSDVNVTAIEWDASERFVSLRRALGVTSFGLNKITLQSRQLGRIRRHREQEEV